MTRWMWLAVAALTVTAGRPTWGQITFTKIAETGTAVPGTGGTFRDFTTAALSGGQIAFGGRNNSFTSGLYSWSAGTITRIADETQAIPSGSGNYIQFFSPSASGANAAYTATGPTQGGDPSQVGVYARIGGTVTVIADRNTPFPGAGANFTLPTTSGNPLVVGNSVAFWGTTAGGANGVFINQGGTITTVSNQNTALPHGTGTFNSTQTVLRDFDGVRALFTAESAGGAQRGLYLGDITTGGITRIVDRTATIPGQGSTAFARFESAKYSGSRVVFTGASASGSLQLYSTDLAGSVTAITTSAQFASGVSSVFAGDGGQVVFSNVANNTLYLAGTQGGPIQRLLGVGDTFDGKTISALSFGPEGFDAGNITFSVRFTDNTSGLYFAPVPEPASVLAVAVGGLAALTALRRRSRTS